MGRKRTDRGRRKRIGGRLLVGFTVVALAFAICTLLGGLPQGDLLHGGPPQKSDSTRDEAPVFCEIHVDAIESTRFLELVNGDHPFDDRDEVRAAPARDDVPFARTDENLHPRMSEALVQLFADAEAAGYTDFYISSGYRDAERQRELYDAATDKSYVQKPGHSEHQTGLAADIAYRGVAGARMADAEEGRWLAENAWKYGLILRYPEGKSETTGIGFEPWHFRYVGQPHARYCDLHGLCFEEYIEFLKTRGGYEMTIDGRKYCVFYEIPRNGIIKAPEGMPYEISGDNTGGFVITTWTIRF